jgi:CubicO group peptidase (beta-lactamase class C family)
MSRDDKALSLKEAVDDIVGPYMARPENAGLAVGIVRDDHKWFFCYGYQDAGRSVSVGGDTIFEIGSITKVFTANLLGSLVLRGEARLDDPIESYLPEDALCRQDIGRDVRLVHLATHTSSLPRLPTNLRDGQADEGNPYAHYQEQQLLECLATYPMRKRVGTDERYSNLGAGLLGYLLGRRLGLPYAEALRRRILDPLSLENTWVVVPESEESRFAHGHGADGKPVGHWDLATLSAAGALRSTVKDVLAYLQANLGAATGEVAAALDLCHQRHSIPLGRPRGVVERWLTPPIAAAVVMGLYQLPAVRSTDFLAVPALLIPIMLSARIAGSVAAIAACALIAMVGWVTVPNVFDPGMFIVLGVFAAYYAGSMLLTRSSLKGLPLAWQTGFCGKGMTEMLWHNGGTGGFCSWASIVKEARAAVVVLSNSANSVDGLGSELMKLATDRPELLVEEEAKDTVLPASTGSFEG